jgi:hypothetical protein
LFAGKNTPSFLALQIGFAMLVLAAIVSLFAFLPVLVGNWRSRPNRIELPNAVFDAFASSLPAIVDD